MDVLLNANVCDQETSAIAQALYEPFNTISREVSGDYGGLMDHLWIDFQLIAPYLTTHKSWRFRFQKRVSGRSRLMGINNPPKFNVGHYSVAPDYLHLVAIPLINVTSYALRLIYDSTSILSTKANSLGAFDAVGFRSKFAAVCSSNGFDVFATTR
jgi:hypothetical protein